MWHKPIAYKLNTTKSEMSENIWKMALLLVVLER